MESKELAAHMGEVYGPAGAQAASDYALSRPPEPLPRVTLFGTENPAAVVERAAAIAGALADVIKHKKLSAAISGRHHVLVEGWTLLGSMLGVFPVCTWTKKLENGWEARVEARTLSGQVVGAAEAQCLTSERNWKSRDDFALRSMAQTRATSKALRLPLGFIVVLAGYEATPAEEMTDQERFEARQDDLGAMLARSIKEVQAKKAEKGGSEPPGAEASCATSSDGTPDDEPPAFLYPDEHTPEEAQTLIKQYAEVQLNGPSDDLDTFDYEKHMKEKGLGQKCVKCEGIVRKFTSSRNGRVYLQCEKAHLLREDAIAAGCDEKAAKGFTKGHSYAYI